LSVAVDSVPDVEKPSTTTDRPVIDLTDRRALAAYAPAAPELIDEARRLKESALLDFGIKDSAVASWLYAKCHYQIPTTAIPTAAVVASGDGTCLLLYNPGFFVSLGIQGVKFVLYHEARHLIQRHLYVDEALRADPVFALAAEVTINHVVLTRLGRDELPRPAGAPKGEEVGIDPRTVHRRYAEDLRGQGLEPLPYDAFVRTDLSVYGELKRMAEPPVPQPVCVHLGEGVPLDPEAVERVAKEVLAEVMRQALGGNEQARRELLDLAARTEGGGDRLERMWGVLGLAALRGQTLRTRRVDWWKRWLTDTLASKLREGERLVYPKKLGAVLLSLGHEPMLSRRGPERTKVVLVAIDTSGSMPDAVVEWLTTLVGRTDGVQAHWLSFDGQVMPFVPGERVLGGGGTNFQNVVDYAEGRLAIGGRAFEEKPDAVIMVTDGYAPHVTPADPGRWIWLITDGGSTWPETHDPPMACHRVTTGDH
jgi:Putative metallopeptidase domain